jgi:hypothetical protein
MSDRAPFWVMQGQSTQPACIIGPVSPVMCHPSRVTHHVSLVCIIRHLSFRGISSAFHHACAIGCLTGDCPLLLLSAGRHLRDLARVARVSPLSSSRATAACRRLPTPRAMLQGVEALRGARKRSRNGAANFVRRNEGSHAGSAGPRPVWQNCQHEPTDDPDGASSTHRALVQKTPMIGSALLQPWKARP